MKRLIFVLVFLLALVLYLVLPAFTSAAAYAPAVGGTGTTTPPRYGQLLVGNGGKTYTLTATSSLGLPTFADLSSLSAFSTTSADFWKSQTDFFSTTSSDWWKTQNDFFATTSADYWQSLTDFFSTTSAQYFVHSSTTIPKTYTANTWVPLQSFSYSSTTYASFVTASSTNQTIGTLTFGGVSSSNWAGFCASITGGAGLCDGTDDTGGGGIAWPFASLNTYATSTVSTSTSIHTQGAFFASSTKQASQFPYASSTTLTAANLFATKLTFVSATSTNFTCVFCQISASANPSTPNSGQLAINTSVGSTSIKTGNGFSIFATSSVGFTWSTTTPSTSATDTIMRLNGPRGIKLENMGCRSVGGTATVAVGDGTSTSTYRVSATATPAPVTLTANNAFEAWETIFVAIGNYSANTVSQVACGFGESNSY